MRRTSAAFALALTAGFLACAALSLAALTVLLLRNATRTPRA
ncbi:MAG TPA: hypothetical protein VFK87_05645 [Steroidobacteraceae bacterium]|nr:hypothetical protein [Steroidobacteraceae bacterium]